MLEQDRPCSQCTPDTLKPKAPQPQVPPVHVLAIECLSCCVVLHAVLHGAAARPQLQAQVHKGVVAVGDIPATQAAHLALQDALEQVVHQGLGALSEKNRAGEQEVGRLCCKDTSWDHDTKAGKHLAFMRGYKNAAEAANKTAALYLCIRYH